MNPVSYQIKRAHLAVIALGRKLFEQHDMAPMTPARFDLLYAILARRPKYGGPLASSQTQLRDDLKLSHPTISKLVKRLVQLGIVRTRRCNSDRRQTIVEITTDGHALLLRAIDFIFNRQPIKSHFTQVVGGNATRAKRKRSWRALIDFSEVCRSFAGRFRRALYAKPDEDGDLMPARYWGSGPMLYCFKDNPFEDH